MDPLLGYFAPHIAVVNLVNRVDRRNETLAELAALGLEPPGFQLWDLVQFGYALETSQQRQLVGEGPLLRPFDGEVTGGHCYAINGSALTVVHEFLLGLLEGPFGDPRRGPMSTDGAFNVIKWELPHLQRLVACPSLADQRKSRSDLRPRWFDQVPGLRQAADSARSRHRRHQRIDAMLS